MRYYGRWMRDEAFRRIGHLYPQATLPDGSQATVIAWLWARTVASPNPAANGVYVPLVSSFMLSTKEGKKAWVEPIIDPDAPDGWRFEVRTGLLSKADEDKTKEGTKFGRGAFACLLSGAPVPLEYIRTEATAGRMRARLMAIVVEGQRSRGYLSPDRDSEAIAAAAKPAWGPEELVTTPSHDVDRLPMYGMPRWRDAFTKRQLVALTTFSDLVADARDGVFAGARAAGLTSSPRLADSGTGAEAYADAVVTYLGCAIDRAADYWSSITTWVPGGEFIRSTFARQAIAMVWDYSEANPFSSGGGNWDATCLEWIDRVLRDLVPVVPAQINLRNAANGLTIKDSAISTDPPYFDNISYADLSDYFYVWTRRTLRDIDPEIFRTVLVPKAEELVASPHRHGGKYEAQEFFMKGMRRALANLRRTANPELPLVIYYAFKQSVSDDSGVASTGWASFLQAILDAGLIIDATLPLRTERSSRNNSIGSNALASSIVMACRRRGDDATVVARAAFLRDLKRELPPALKLLQAGNTAPVDLAQASIGPGMAIFSRYAKVLNADDTPTTVKSALQDINAALDGFLSEQEAEYDANTRFAITWFDQAGNGGRSLRYCRDARDGARGLRSAACARPELSSRAAARFA